MKILSALVMSLASLALASCASDAAEVAPASDGEVHPVTLWNRSQFAIDDIYLHEPGESYQDVEPLELDAPLATEAKFGVSDFVSGSLITFVRARPDGRAIAVTSSEPIYVDREGFTVVLFDDSFRLLEP